MKRLIVIPSLPSIFAVLILSLAGTGCTVVSVADAVVSTTVDVAVGTAKVAGKAVGKVVDVVTPDGDD
jgi:hypothetical protein